LRACSVSSATRRTCSADIDWIGLSFGAFDASVGNGSPLAPAGDGALGSLGLPLHPHATKASRISAWRSVIARRYIAVVIERRSSARSALLDDENRGRLVRLFVDLVVADTTGEIHIHLAEAARVMKVKAAA